VEKLIQRVESDRSNQLQEFLLSVIIHNDNIC
jgi:hypothetical protein